ncbi:bestrophin family ion channel [Rhodocytophaga aerolata]|uniref:Bestrophin family ion channel n=1 Tax=Rhodocytophaga aerolata TaxID=455078 RepID=A0ABT8R3W3_9BACT|nr:bestrophin family ion channel [Rhodocytophaga aerolata]MDO1446796.1 bestrophin family ion channel [Rhodocytophaga aerolata]
MVIYDNKEWIETIVNFYRSYIIRQIFRSTLLVGLITAVLSFIVMEVLQLQIKFHSNVFSLLGIVLSILLVFRTNTAYDRWWEGRKLWGGLVNNSRNMALMVHSLLEGQATEDRNFYAKHIANFAIAMKEHLRKGVKLEELHHLDPVEQKIYQSRQHIPNHIISQLYERTQQLQKNGTISGYDAIPLKTHLQAFTDILGACERIKKTPIPFSYSIYIKTFIMLYTVILPFGLLEEFGYYTILLVMFIFYAFIGVELMAEEIEDPFGLDCNDLPTGNIATTIKNNTYEILCLYAEVEKEDEKELYEKVF